MAPRRRGVPTATSYLWVSRLAAEKYLEEKQKSEPNKHELMLYYGSFFFFARASLDALRKSDGKLSPSIKTIQDNFFKAHIQDHPVFLLLKNERNNIGHGDDAWGNHPMIPIGMIDRFQEAGHSWDVAVFDEIWPDGIFKGKNLEEVMSLVWRQVSDWLRCNKRARST